MPPRLQPKQRLLRHGSQSLSDRELLAIVLRSGSPKVPALEVADRLLETAGSLRRVLSFGPEIFRAQGIGEARSVTLLATAELVRRLARSRIARRKLLGKPQVVASYLLSRLSDNGQEILGALYLDVHNRLIAESEVFRGTLGRVAVEPRAILKEALLHSAAGLVLWHRHPTGDPDPTREDLGFTRRMVASAELLGIRLLDHLILGSGGRWVSLAQRYPWSTATDLPSSPERIQP